MLYFYFWCDKAKIWKTSLLRVIPFDVPRKQSTTNFKWIDEKDPSPDIHSLLKSSRSRRSNWDKYLEFTFLVSTNNSACCLKFRIITKLHHKIWYPFLYQYMFQYNQLFSSIGNRFSLLLFSSPWQLSIAGYALHYYVYIS